jgi:hypothetical protein
MARKQEVLDDNLGVDNNHFVALTTHSYTVSTILAVLGMQPFRFGKVAVLLSSLKLRRWTGNENVTAKINCLINYQVPS